MADDSLFAHTSPASVYAVLANARLYERFVVGNSHVRGFDSEWPAAGANLHHALGVRPFVIEDFTTSLGTDGETYLSLLTRMGFLGATITTFSLHPRADGTEIAIKEEPLWGLAEWMWSKVVDWVLHQRNRKVLANLARLATEQMPAADRPPPAPVG